MTNNCKAIALGKLVKPWRQFGLNLASRIYGGRDVVIAIDLTESVGLNAEGRLRLTQIIEDSLQSGDTVYVVPFASEVNPLQPDVDPLTALRGIKFRGKPQDIEQKEIESGRLKVFFQDECHLLWGDVCGYVWGRTKERITVPMTNERYKQTYYGAIDLKSHELLVQPYNKGESSSSIAFLKYLQEQYPKSRIALIWDGASYHRSGEVKSYLH